MTEDEADEASLADLDAICGAVLRLAVMALAAAAAGGVATWAALALAGVVR